MKSKIIIIFGVIITLLGFAYMINYFKNSIFNYRNNFIKEFEFSLPSSSVIQKYKYDPKEQHIWMKIAIESKDKNYLEDNFKKYYNLPHKQFEYLALNEEDIYWWKIDKERIVYYMEATAEGKKGAKTRSVIIYIVDDQKEKLSMYISL